MDYRQLLYELLRVLSGYRSTIITVNAVVAIFSIILNWRILNKTKHSGFLQFIPIYNRYLEFKLYWRKGFFWLYCISMTLGLLAVFLAANNIASSIIVILLILAIIFSFFPIILVFKKARCFDKGFFFGLGLLILPLLFKAILAFGKSEYHKN